MSKTVEQRIADLKEAFFKLEGKIATLKAEKSWLTREIDQKIESLEREMSRLQDEANLISAGR